jgi:hypothetical protein
MKYSRSIYFSVRLVAPVSIVATIKVALVTITATFLASTGGQRADQKTRATRY